MGFFSIFTRKNEPGPVGEPVDEVHRARTQARQRLIGAVVLLAIGIVGFPLVFETQPRPIPIDIPIEIPRKDGAPPLPAPPSKGTGPVGSSASLAGRSDAARLPREPDRDEMITESREDGSRDSPLAAAPDDARGSEPMVAASGARPAPSKSAAVRPESSRLEAKSAARPEAGRAESRADPKIEPGSVANDDGARARALLDGKGAQAPLAASGEGTRFIVQVGAFADEVAAQGTRQRIERLGLKTYTQVANTPAGNRIRVRVGPFPTRGEADKALAKARSAGLSAVVLTL